MMTTNTARRLGTFAVAAALALGACGSDADDAADPGDDTGSDLDCASAIDAPDGRTESMDDMDDMDMSSMNMGDATATPAGDVDGAALACGDFVVLETRPAGYDDVAGSAVIARSEAGTTVTAQVSGLLPDTDYVSHVHERSCSDNGGDHFQFVDGTVEVPPNEIHLAFTSDGDGDGYMTAENDSVAGDDAVAFVVHPVEFIDNKIACVDFVAEDPDAVAAAIESGPAFDETTIDGMEGMDMSDSTDSTAPDDTVAG